LSKVYYCTEGYWKGYTAITKLAKEANVSEEEAKGWLEKQALWQIYLPPSKYIPRPHWSVDIPNKVHQADLLFLPHDKVGRKTYKYALLVIDVASRYKDAELLTSKNSSEVANAFTTIYSRKLLRPQKIIIDHGREFMGDVTSLFEKHKVTIQRSEAGNHRAQAFVETPQLFVHVHNLHLKYTQDVILSRIPLSVEEFSHLVYYNYQTSHKERPLFSSITLYFLRYYIYHSNHISY